MFDIDGWLQIIFRKLEALRKIRTDRDKRDAITAELKAVKYSELEARRAEPWILYGDWKFKKDIEISDFWPPEGFKAPGGSGRPDERLAVYVAQCEQRSYRDGYGDGYRAGKADRTPDESDELIRSLQKDLLAEKAAKADLHESMQALREALASQTLSNGRLTHDNAVLAAENAQLRRNLTEQDA